MGTCYSCHKEGFLKRSVKIEPPKAPWEEEQPLTKSCLECGVPIQYGDRCYRHQQSFILGRQAKIAGWQEIQFGHPDFRTCDACEEIEETMWLQEDLVLCPHCYQELEKESD